MTTAIAEVIACAALVVTLAAALARPRKLNEAVVAVPAAALLVALGIVPWSDAWHAAERFAPPVLFLATILLFGQLCSDAGVFRYFGAVAGRVGRGHPRRLLRVVVALAAMVTVTLTLDATIVLLTPVIVHAAAHADARTRPHLYAGVRLANSASLLLPVSNLTNLLAFSVADLSFGKFALLMAPSWIFACVAEWGAIRWFFRRDLARPNPGAASSHSDAPDAHAPRYAIAVAAVTVLAIAALVSVNLSPAWAALAGSAALVVGDRATRKPVRAYLRSMQVGFCLFVLALAIIVTGVTRHGLGDLLAALAPHGSGYLAVVGMAFLAALVANVVNNLPATLALLPLVAHDPPLLLAMLIGVNIGPNMTFGGSLATLLWRRILAGDHQPRARTFHAFAAITVPLVLLGSASLLWVTLQI